MYHIVIVWIKMFFLTYGTRKKTLANKIFFPRLRICSHNASTGRKSYFFAFCGKTVRVIWSLLPYVGAVNVCHGWQSRRHEIKRVYSQDSHLREVLQRIFSENELLVFEWLGVRRFSNANNSITKRWNANPICKFLENFIFYRILLKYVGKNKN